MNTNQVQVESFPSRALALVMGVDRVFLFRELFVALAIILAVTGLVFAQRPANHRKPTNLNSSQPAAVTESSTISKEKTIVGETKPLGLGQVRSWVSLDRNGNPTAIGLTFSEAALSALPTEPPPGELGTEISLALPAEASRTAFKHIGLNWNPNGHVPVKIYDTAHFDFHFYMIAEAERNAITAKGDDLLRAKKQPAAEFVPEGYIYVPDSEHARMGAHWINPLSKELQGQTFTSTFLYGSYNGSLIFGEPMITRAFLETKTNLTELIKLPGQYARRAYYPTKYSVRYDAATKEYTVALEGMTLR
ncbi:MAG: hypothetical protein QOH25_2014 [Acidobacteriota bacterium]|jgi:hypothetical protein|nr:hypothetical protein [Acidobacteriota bacterium]